MYRGRLERDLDRWVGQGLIDGDTSRRMLAEFDSRESAFSLGRVLMMIAALLIAGAVLLLVAANWDAIPRLARLIGIVALIAVASGEEPPDLIRRCGSELLWSAGWAVSGNLPASDWEVLDYARPTWNALRVASDDHRSMNRKSVPEELRQLARAALRADAP